MPRIRSAFAVAALLAAVGWAGTATPARAQPAAAAAGEPDASLPRVIASEPDAHIVGSVLMVAERALPCIGGEAAAARRRLTAVVDGYRRRGSNPEWLAFARGMGFAAFGRMASELAEARSPASRDALCRPALENGREALQQLTGQK